MAHISRTELLVVPRVIVYVYRYLQNA